MKNIAFLAILILLLSIKACDSSISQFRGTDRDGIYSENKLADSWPEDGPELLWIHEGLGKGFAAPTLTEREIFINAEADGESYTLALDLQGKQIWKSENGKEFLGEGFSSTYPGARTSPTHMKNLLYAGSGTGRISCFNAKDGEVVWSVDLMKEMDGILGYFGYSESPAIDEKFLYCFPGGLENNLVALDRFKGEVAWSTKLLQDTFAYGSIVPLDLPEAKILLGSSRYYIYTADRETGDLLASYELEGYQYDGEHCNTAVYKDGFVYFVANDNPGQGAVKLRLADDGSSFEEVWRNPEVLNNFGGFVVVDGSIFTTLKGNKLVKLDPDSGEITDSLKVETGSIIYADSKFICYGNKGEVQLVNYTDGKLTSGGKFRIKEGSGNHFAHPVVKNGVLYIRRGNALMAYKIGQ